MPERNKAINECIFWIKDWYAEDMPYGLKGIIRRLNKLKSMSNLVEDFKKEFIPEITDHLTCGNDQCMYDGKWCYHLTDKEFDKMINFLKKYE